MILLISLLPIFFVAYILYYGSKDPTVELTDEFIEIKGGVFYSVKYELNALSKVETVTILPGIRLRTNGFGGFGVSRGYFRTDENESIMLFTDKSSNPYIYLEFNGEKKVYVNFKDPEDTNACYNAIKNKLIWK